MTARGARAVIVALAVLARVALPAFGAAPAACNANGQACAPSDFQFCDCPSGPRGYQQCLDDGSRYGACDCSGTIPQGAGGLVEAGPDADGATKADGGKVGFLQPCATDSECTTNLCFPLNAYGPHCSQPCSKDVDCPPPSPGCSNKGVCKLH